MAARRIRAAVARGSAGHAHFSIEDVELEGPRPDELLVRMVATGICGTDIWMCTDTEDDAMPMVLGHEGAGIVEEVGDAVPGFAPGDRVVLSYQSCGRCPACRAGRPYHCARFVDANFAGARLDGSNAMAQSGVRGHFFGQSSFATYALATPRNAVKVGDDPPLPLLAPLACGLLTGAGTVINTLQAGAGARIAIFGVGTVGLAAVMAAHDAGADVIVAVDILPQRLEAARDVGATHALLSDAPDLGGTIGRIGGGGVDYGVDYAVDTCGDPHAVREAVRGLAPHGQLALVAEPGLALAMQPGQRRVAIAMGDAVPQTFIPELIGRFRAGRFPFDRLVRFYPFADINRAVADVERGDTVKAVLQFT